MDKILTVEIDSLPLSMEPCSLIDQTSFLLGNLMYEKCISEDESKSVFKSIKSRNNNTEFVFTLKQIYWNNDEKLTSQHVLNGYKESLTSKAPFLWLTNIINKEIAHYGIEILDEASFVLYLKEPFYYIKNLFKTYLFVPTKIKNNTITYLPGSHEFVQPLNNDVLILKKRKGIMAKFDYILFVKTETGKQGIKLFFEDKIDITCNTHFPFQNNSKYSKRIKKSDLLLTCQLELNTNRIDTENRKRIVNSIDNVFLSDKLNSYIKPLHSFCSIWITNTNKIKAEVCSQQTENKRTLILYYSNFSPNQNIAFVLAKQIKDECGITIKPVGLTLEEYTNKVIQKDYDLILTLTPLLYDDPSCLFNYFRYDDYFDSERDKSDFDSLVRLGNALKDSPKRDLCYLSAEDILRKQYNIFPIGSFFNIYLTKNDKIEYCKQGFLNV